MKPNEPAKILPELPQGARLLILRLRSMGDMVMLTPALAALHAWRPDLRLDVVAQPAFSPVLEGNPAINEIIPFKTVLTCAQGLRRNKYPVVFNQHGGPTSAVLAASAKIPLRVSWNHVQFGFVYNVRVPGPSQFFGARPVHTVEHRLTQFYYTGLPRGPIPAPKIYPQPAAVESVREKLRGRGIGDTDRYAVIHPGASHLSKQWSLAGFAEMARWLLRMHHMQPVVRVGPSDQPLIEAIGELFPAETRVIDAKEMDLRETIALIAGSSFFLGNDSGPAHVAAATGRPLVVIYGATDPATWRPWETPHRVVQSRGPCPKCASGGCYASEGGRCILSVATEEVMQACASMLSE